MQRQVSLDRAIGKDVHFVHLLSVLEDHLTLFKELLLQLVDKCLQHIDPQVLEVRDVEELTFQPLLVLILVLH